MRSEAAIYKPSFIHLDITTAAGIENIIFNNREVRGKVEYSNGLGTTILISENGNVTTLPSQEPEYFKFTLRLHEYASSRQKFHKIETLIQGRYRAAFTFPYYITSVTGLTSLPQKVNASDWLQQTVSFTQCVIEVKPTTRDNTQRGEGATREEVEIIIYNNKCDYSLPNAKPVADVTCTIPADCDPVTVDLSNSTEIDGDPISTSSNITIQYNFNGYYIVEINSNDDPAVVGNWTYIGGTRTFLQFQTEVIAEIDTGVPGYSAFYFEFDPVVLFGEVGSVPFGIIANITESGIISENATCSFTLIGCSPQLRLFGDSETEGTFNGGTGGEWENEFEMLNADSTPVGAGAGKYLRLTLKFTDGSGPPLMDIYCPVGCNLLSAVNTGGSPGALTGNQVIDIEGNFFVADTTTGADPFQNYITTGNISNAGIFSYNKKTYALDTDKRNSEAKETVLCGILTTPSGTSAMDDVNFRLRTETEQYLDPFGIWVIKTGASFVGDVFVAGNNDDSIRHYMNALNGVHTIFTTPSGENIADVAADDRSIVKINGESIYYAIAGNYVIEFNASGAASTVSPESNWIINMPGDIIYTFTRSARRLFVNENIITTGKPDIWVTTDGNSDGLALLRYNGATWTKYSFISPYFDPWGASQKHGQGIQMDDAGRLYFVHYLDALAQGGRIVMAEFTGASYTNPADWTYTTIAGITTTPGNVDGTGDVATFSRRPYGLQIIGYTPTTNFPIMLLCDQENHTIRKIEHDDVSAVAFADVNWNVSTVYGQAGVPGSLDGVGTAATLEYPNGIDYDSANNKVYITENLPERIRYIDLNTDDVVTFSGGNGPGLTDNDIY